MFNLPPFSTIELLAKTLGTFGYTYRTIMLGQATYTQFTSPDGHIWITSNTHISYPFVTSTARMISDQKYLAYDLVASIGGRVPRTTIIDPTDYQQTDLAKVLEQAPLVVKPNNSSLSHGLTLNIRTPDQLTAAIAFAAEYSSHVLIQEQVEGQEIRFVVLDGKVTAALLRETPRLIGNGSATIEELLKRENAERSKIKVPYLSYPQLAEPLISLAGLDLSRVPAAGELVELGRSTMIAGGASVYNIIEDIHPSYLKTAKKLAGALGQGFVVVDMFVQDHTQPQTDDNYAFIEYNMSPVVKLFYSCRDGHNYDVLSELVPLIDQSLHRRKAHA